MVQDNIIFLGPTLSLQDATAIYPGGIYRDPVQCGDVLQAIEEHPKAIAIIDGTFECNAAVWHKEILMALNDNIAVFGASSMGALRAAELKPLGMRAVGKIANDFANGVLNDDDEVAVLHAPKEAHYRCITDAMVNIRATLSKALNDKIISKETYEGLIQLSKETFYKRRLLTQIIQVYQKTKSASLQAECNRLLEGLVDNYVDQKRLDAIKLLTLLNTSPCGFIEHDSTVKFNQSIQVRFLQHQIAQDEISESFSWVLQQTLILADKVAKNFPSLKSGHFDVSKTKQDAHLEALVMLVYKIGDTEVSQQFIKSLFIINQLCDIKKLTSKSEFVAGFIDAFRLENNLADKDIFIKWLEKQELSLDCFYQYMQQLCRLDYFLCAGGEDILFECSSKQSEHDALQSSCAHQID